LEYPEDGAGALAAGFSLCAQAPSVSVATANAIKAMYFNIFPLLSLQLQRSFTLVHTANTNLFSAFRRV
jgi:hypothetical protein